jgi:hypothetical protein
MDYDYNNYFELYQLFVCKVLPKLPNNRDNDPLI